MRRTTIATLLAAASLALTGCGGSDNNDSSATASDTPASASMSGSEAPVNDAFTMDAQAVVDAFAAAGLPVTDARDSTGGSCTNHPGCEQQVTTEDITVVRFNTEANGEAFVDGSIGGAYRRGLVVLSYTAARTPEEARPQYEQVLMGL